MSNFIETALAKVNPQGPNITNLKKSVAHLDDRLDALEAVLRPAAHKPVPYPAFPDPVNDPDNIDGFTRKDVGELIAAILRSGQDLGRRRRAVESIYEEFKAVTGARLVGISASCSLGTFNEEVGDAAYWAREAVKAREKVKSLQRPEDQCVPASVRASSSGPRSLGAFSEEVGDAAYWVRVAIKAHEKAKAADLRVAATDSLLEAANGRVSDLEAAIHRKREENERLRKELAEARKAVVVKLPGGATVYLDPKTGRTARC